MGARRARAICAALSLAPCLSSAQSTSARAVARADTLLARGDVARAESIYYATSDARPRDPVARAALGRYLASRGALKVAVVLLEEARRFGGDERAIGRDLAPIFRMLGDHQALARLPGSPLTSEERMRAGWLVASGSSARMPESIRLTYTPEHETTSIGRIGARVNGTVGSARIDPTLNGILIDRDAAASLKVRTFPPNPVRRDTVLGVVDSLVIGAVAWTNVPVTITRIERGPLAIGLGFLARYAPTLDGRRSLITVRATGKAPADSTAQRYPLLLSPEGPRVLFGGRWLSFGAPELRAQRTTMLLTLDTKRGVVLLSR